MKNKTQIEDVQKDLAVLGLSIDESDSVTSEEAKCAYRKATKKMHPDKADPTNLEEVARYTAAFQEVGNSYQRILMYIVLRISANHEDRKKQYSCDGDIFMKENFDKFNFPAENKGSFTVRVEDKLAEVWRDTLEWQYGKPRVVRTPNGVESDRFWKVKFCQIELTVHFYNHNKSKDKKQNKLMIQGSDQSTICEYVFTELPKMYKIVCEKKVSMPNSIIHPKRKRINTPNKRRNIKFKSASKLVETKCAMCDFASNSNVSMIRHMKSMHTQQSSRNLNVIHEETEIPHRVLLEDMSVCDISVEDGVDTDKEELLTEIKICRICMFKATNQIELETHLQSSHGEGPDSNLSEDIIETTQGVFCSSVYNCDECPFTPTIAESLKEHKEELHKRVNALTVDPKEHLLTDVPPVPESVEDMDVVSDIPEEILVQDPMMEKANDANDFEIVVEKLSCNSCDFEGNDTFTVEEHTSSKHENRISDDDIDKLGGMILAEFFCNACQFISDNCDDLNSHYQLFHKSNNTITTAEKHAQLETVLGEGEVASNVENLSGMNCKKCSKPFLNQEILEEHMTEKHLIMNVFKCTSCQYRTTNRDNYRIHADTKHLVDTVKQNDGEAITATLFECQYCVFTSESK